MKFRLAAAFVAAICIGFASPAQACRLLVIQPEALAAIRSVVLVSVETSARVESPGWNTWRLTARTVRAIAGSPRPSQYEFTVTLSSDGCGQTPLPPKGERWVLYLDPSGNGKVEWGFPLADVKDHDRRLSDVD